MEDRRRKRPAPRREHGEESEWDIWAEEEEEEEAVQAFEWAKELDDGMGEISPLPIAALTEGQLGEGGAAPWAIHSRKTPQAERIPPRP